MKLLHTTLLTISCASLSLYSMEQGNHLDYYAINDIYKKADATLKHYNPTDIQTTIDLSQIIAKTKELKLRNINEKQIGQFAYNQADQLQYKICFSAKAPYHNPHYISVFFKKIGQYNNHLEKNQFTSPTPQQFQHYINNQKIKAAIEDIKLFIDLDTIDKEKKVIVDIPMSIATKEFRDLTNNISAMRVLDPETIRMIADMLYMENPQKTSEKL